MKWGDAANYHIALDSGVIGIGIWPSWLYPMHVLNQ